MSSIITISSPGFPNLSNNFTILITTHDGDEWHVALSFALRFLVYVAILMIFFVILALIVKFLGNWEETDASETATVTERIRLVAKDAVPLTYGTCEEEKEEDLESGKCSSSSSGSSEDLYDGKICVICYDDRRNCFFVPCGHCATCYDCAQRIKEEENKTCPVCRRYIGKVRKLLL